MNDEASELITVVRLVAQGNTIGPLTFAVVKEIVTKWPALR